MFSCRICLLAKLLMYIIYLVLCNACAKVDVFCGSAMSESVSACRRQRSMYRVHYALPASDEPRPWPFGAQVAGHSGDDGARFTGLLQCNNGTVLKPILKEAQRREVEFYERISNTKDPALVQLRPHVPKYYGCRRFTYNGYANEYLILEDLTEGMSEPCIMDVKIGRITYDPLATSEKIRNEDSKYAACKQEFAFCIPGFQVYQQSTGKLFKYGKDYGKKLHGKMVKDVFRRFVRCVDGALCRTLVLQHLSRLWAVQRVAAAPRPLLLRSCSLLLQHDARAVRECCGPAHRTKPQCIPEANGHRRRSVHSIHSVGSFSSFSGQLSPSGPIYQPVAGVPITPITFANQTFSTPSPITSPWSEALDSMDRLHSFDNNYEGKMSEIKMDYKATLDQLCSDGPALTWGTVKIIDFAHAFFNDEPKVDENFKEGIDNIVQIFEELLKETDEVF